MARYACGISPPRDPITEMQRLVGQGEAKAVFDEILACVKKCGCEKGAWNRDAEFAKIFNGKPDEQAKQEKDPDSAYMKRVAKLLGVDVQTANRPLTRMEDAKEPREALV